MNLEDLNLSGSGKALGSMWMEYRFATITVLPSLGILYPPSVVSFNYVKMLTQEIIEVVYFMHQFRTLFFPKCYIEK